jgi:hypothetical protein
LQKWGFWLRYAARLDIKVSEVAATAAGHQDFAAWLLTIIQ